MQTGTFAIAVPNSTTISLNDPMNMDLYGGGRETAGSMAWPGLVGLSPNSLGEIECPS